MPILRLLTRCFQVCLTESVLSSIAVRMHGSRRNFVLAFRSLFRNESTKLEIYPLQRCLAGQSILAHTLYRLTEVRFHFDQILQGFEHPRLERCLQRLLRGLTLRLVRLE